MVTSNSGHSKAAALADARASGDWLAWDDLDGGHIAALGLQIEVLDEFLRRGEALGGWKVGMTSGGARDMMGEGFRPFGYVLKSRRLKSGDILPATIRDGGRIEAEVGLLLGAPLRGPDLTPEQCRKAVSQICPAFEINELRVDTAKQSLLIADGLGQWGIVVGEGMALPPDFTIGRARLYRDAQLLVTSEPGLVIDDPFLSLSRLVAELDRFGRGLEAGQVVITGALLHHDIDGPGTYRAVFDDLGEVSLSVPAVAGVAA
jgi:2-keto-4-pentenoate hydratase